MYYKVVRFYQFINDHFNLSSVYIRGKGRVIYTPGTPTYPPSFAIKEGRGLLVFDSIENAREYSSNIVHNAIWECEVTNPRAPQNICYALDIELYEQFREDKDCRWPKGTVEVDSVTLTRKVK